MQDWSPALCHEDVIDLQDWGHLQPFACRSAARLARMIVR